MGWMGSPLAQAESESHAMRLLQDPTLQLFIVWLVAPIFAMLGTSLETSVSDFSETLAGWFVTFSLWSGFGIRCVFYQWKAMPRLPQKRWPDLSKATFLELNLLAGIALVTLLSLIAAVLVFALLTDTLPGFQSMP